MDLDFMRAPNTGYPTAEYERIRAEGKVVWNETLKGWMVTTFEDIKKVLIDPKSYGNEDTAIKDAFGAEAMLFQDSQIHDKLRAVWIGHLMPKSVEARGDLLRDLTDTLLQPVIARLRAGETVDLVPVFQDFTTDAITTFMEVPSERRADFQRWNRVLSDSSQLVIPKGDPRFALRESTKREVFDFLEAQVDQRRGRLARGEPLSDLVSLMVSAEGRGGITRSMVSDNLLNLFIGALDTTVRWMGNIVVVLHRYPEAMREVIADRALIFKAFEEVMRFETVVQVNTRRVLSDRSEIGGQPLPRGQEIFVLQGIGNRDPAAFEAPDVFDIHRPAKSHLGFGFGMHQCLGMHLARGEAAAFFNRFFDLMPALDIVEADYGPKWALWGPFKLLVRASGTTH